VPNILAIAASARRDGNSDTALACALEGIKAEAPDAEVQTIAPYGLPITPCRSCNGCWKTGRCVVKDEMQDLYPQFCEADHIVVASPIYFTSLPGHFKVLIDRFQCFWVRTFLLKDPLKPRRTGMFLCVGAMDRNRYYEGALTIIRTWMLVLNMKWRHSEAQRLPAGRTRSGSGDDPHVPRPGRRVGHWPQPASLSASCATLSPSSRQCLLALSSGAPTATGP